MGTRNHHGAWQYGKYRAVCKNKGIWEKWGTDACNGKMDIVSGKDKRPQDNGEKNRVKGVQWTERLYAI